MHINWKIAGGIMMLLGLIACQTIIPEGLEPRNLPIGADDQLRSVWFSHPDTGYVVGGQRFSEDVILKTTDGGQSWLRQRPTKPFDKILFDLYMLDGSRGYAAGLDGKILRTLDGGLTWALPQVPGWKPMHAIAAIDRDTLVAVGGNGYDEGILARSTDGGATWAIVDSLDRELRDVVLVGPERLVACGYGIILWSEDAGRTWQRSEEGRGEFFVTLHFPTSQTGYAAGRTGTIMKTEDGGSSWTRLRNGNNPFAARRYINAIQFLDADRGFLVGDQGLMARTLDGGDSWDLLELDTKADLHDLFIWPEGDGYLVGESATLYVGRF